MWKTQLAVVSIAGPQRTGKSFLANRLLKRYGMVNAQNGWVCDWTFDHALHEGNMDMGGTSENQLGYLHAGDRH